MIRKFFHKVSTAALAIFIAMGVILSPAALADDKTPTGEADTRVQTFIRLAQAKSLSEVNAADLTADEARFLGTFVSNFYVPFRSEFSLGSLGQDKADKERQEQTLKAIASSLQKTVNFDEKTAETFSRTVVGNVWKGSVNLKLGYTSTPWDKITKSTQITEVPNVQVSWFALQHLLGGSFFKPEHKFMQAKTGVLFYQVNGKNIPAFTFDPTGETLTPSVVALYQSLQMADLGSGYGFSLLDLNLAEVNFSKTPEGDSAKNVIAALEKSSVEVTTFNSNMAISPYGDLVVKGPQHSYVAIPASMNPVTWIPVNGDSKDSERSPATAYIGASFQNIALLATGKSGWSGGGKKYSPSHAISAIKDQLGEPSSQGLFPWRIQTGSSSTSASYDAGFFVNGSGWGDFWSKLTASISKKFTHPGGYGDSNSPSIVIGAVNPKYGSGYWPLMTIDGSIRATGGAKFVASGDPGTNLTYRGKVYLVDTLQAYEGEDTNHSQFIEVLTGNTPLAKLSVNADQGSVFEKALATSSETILKVSESMPPETSATLYLTYTLAAFGDEPVKKSLGYRYNSDLPTLVDKKLPIDATAAKDARVEAIINYSYFFLNPSWDVADYTSTWLNVKISSWLVKWHEDMIGTQAVGILPGSTKYIGFAGFVSTPNLYELSWTDSLISLWYSVLPFVIILMTVILIIYALMKVFSFQRAIGGALLFGVLAASIIPATNVAIDVSNSFTNSFYSSRFTYWALLTHQSYSDAIDTAATGDSYQNYLQTIFNNSVSLSKSSTTVSSEGISNRGGENILLRWQSPKKHLAVDLGDAIHGAVNSNTSLKKLVRGVVTANFQGETFVDDPNSKFLFRSYIDISNASRYNYLGLSNRWDTQKQPFNKNPDTSNWSKGLKSNYAKYQDTIDNDVRNGYTNPAKNSTAPEDLAYVTPVLSSRIVSDHFSDVKKIEAGLSLNDKVGIPSGAFSAPITPMTKGTSFIDAIRKQSPEGYDVDSAGYSEQDYAGLAAYSLMSESPYYHFSWHMFDHGMNPTPSGSGSYSSMLLAAPDQGYFYNTVVYDTKGVASKDTTAQNSGELKDYLGMRELFTYTIPYLKQGNDVVQAYEDKFGLQFYPELPFTPGHENDPEIKLDPSNTQKYWQNVNVVQLSNMYTPWVDLMYQASYAKPTTVVVNGKTVPVSDPLDPSTYPEGRPMVFSPAEMYDYGLTYADLTSVEQRIVDTLKDTKNDFFELLNYYSFKDSVVTSAASMKTTFNFNKNFSDVKWFGVSTNLYPQSYELKNFSYDAYLRLILANSLGIDLTDSSQGTNFYASVVQSSSLTTAVMFIVTDFVSINIFPVLKYGLLMALIVLSIFTSITSVLKVETGSFAKRVGRSIITPLIAFLLISMLFSWVIGLMMGNIATPVTGELNPSLKFGDPVLTMMGLTILALACSFGYGYFLWGAIKDIKLQGTLALSSIGATLASASSAAMKSVSSKGSQWVNKLSGGRLGASGFSSSGATPTPTPVAVAPTTENDTPKPTGRPQSPRPVPKRRPTSSPTRPGASGGRRLIERTMEEGNERLNK